ncbi:MAG: type II toxin-antitoxin system RelE/ParE family toxin [Oscillospiraceae bacterium]|jgi:mRNA-degrading endonuclease RelE of RelBE toxin-antitoxin system|nr:type II toxin-antitoxin system RelE/ParE family toxin [Oscillospiraceae bacterium]
MSDEPKVYSIAVHDDAAQMLYNHVRFLANVSIPAARKLRTALYEAVASLETLPHRCPAYPARRTSVTYRKLLVGRYQVIFSVSEEKNMVNIRYFLCCADKLMSVGQKKVAGIRK